MTQLFNITPLPDVVNPLLTSGDDAGRSARLLPNTRTVSSRTALPSATPKNVVKSPMTIINNIAILLQVAMADTTGLPCPGAFLDTAKWPGS